MLRAENSICGTSTTGTGTLTLAACPSPPGGADLYAAFTGTGSLGTSQTTPVGYTIIEYTDANFTTAKAQEVGMGALLLGGSITACTLARTTPQQKCTGMDTTTPTYTGGAPSAITIGTAANVLVFIGANASYTPAYSPYFTSGGIGPVVSPSATTAAGNVLVTATDYYFAFEWRTPMLVKKATLNVATSYKTGSPVSNAYFRLYEYATDAKAGKLLLDLGLLGSAGTSLNATGNVSTAVHGTGYMLLPGEYVANVIAILSGGSAGPNMSAYPAGNLVTSGRFGLGSGLNPTAGATATGGNGATPADPANTTGWALQQAGYSAPAFLLSPS